MVDEPDAYVTTTVQTISVFCANCEAPVEIVATSNDLEFKLNKAYLKQRVFVKHCPYCGM